MSKKLDITKMLDFSEMDMTPPNSSNCRKIRTKLLREKLTNIMDMLHHTQKCPLWRTLSDPWL